MVELMIPAPQKGLPRGQVKQVKLTKGEGAEGIYLFSHGSCPVKAGTT